MTEADKFQTAIERLAADTAAQARRIANRRNITRADKVVRLAGLLNRANATATGLADVFTSRQMEALTGQPAPARGLLPTDDSRRLIKAVRTALADRGTALDRVERLARSEPLYTGQQAVTEAMTGRRPGRGGYWGWRRLVDAGACAQCRHLARNGRVWPADHRLYSPHPNCACTQQIVHSATRPRPVRKRKR